MDKTIRLEVIKKMKRWYESKTLWINIIAVISFAVQTFTGKDIIRPEYQGIALCIVNFMLRLITKHELI